LQVPIVAQLLGAIAAAILFHWLGVTQGGKERLMEKKIDELRACVAIQSGHSTIAQ
jgi:hypothetical protein